jgi:hypothetical protein
MKALHSKGGYGIFQSTTRNQDFFHRGLLWQRTVRELRKIDGVEVPTWSWMGYEGEIRYMNVPFLDIEKNRDIESPFEGLEVEMVHGDLDGDGPAELRARVWGVKREVKGRIIWDEVQETIETKGASNDGSGTVLEGDGKMRCVIVGKSLKPREDGRIAYVIMVRPLANVEEGKGDREKEREKIYQRRGVGYLNVDDLEEEGSDISGELSRIR